MKVVLIGSLALVMLTLGGVPATATGQSAGTDSVVGTARECLFRFEEFCEAEVNVSVGVESGPAGQNPTGALRLVTSGPGPGDTFIVDAEATCLSVSGKVAIVGVTGTELQPRIPVEFPIAGLIRFVDAGGPDSAADAVEVAYTRGEVFGPPLPGPTSCSTFPATFPSVPRFPDFANETGDVVVTDTLPFPTTKAQCKNGGWRTFGVLRNQGDCVSFVATGGKNPPASSP